MDKRILLLFGSIVISIIFAEGALIFFPDFTPFPRAYPGEYEDSQKKFWVNDQKSGWRMAPNATFQWNSSDWNHTIQSNSQGYRAMVDFSYSKNKRRIVLVGDSFTFGTGVYYSDTFGAIIESKLIETEVYNMAMPGFGIDQMWLSVRYQALPLKPDLIIVGINDSDFKRSQTGYRFQEQYNKPLFKLVKGELIRQTSEDQPNPIIRFAEKYSRLWTAGRLIGRWIAYQIPFGEWWYLNKALLDSMRKDCDKAGIPVVFMYIPTKAWRAFPTLTNYMEQSEANFINLQSGMKSPEPGLYFPIDGHLSIKGNKYAANQVLEWLKKNRLNFNGTAVP